MDDIFRERMMKEIIGLEDLSSGFVLSEKDQTKTEHKKTIKELWEGIEDYYEM